MFDTSYMKYYYAKHIAVSCTIYLYFCLQIDVSVDNCGVILETQCECAAGMGPTAHCKHVQCLLYALIMFTKNKRIETAETCTQKLQTFHQCKRYRGSPLKAAQLILRKEASAGDRNIKTLQSFDPRPPSLRNESGYVDYVNNICINFQADIATENTDKLPMPILQTIPPANVFAIAHDHNYLKDSPEEAFLKSFGIRKMTMKELQEIETTTRQQADSIVWRTERIKRIPSSKFGIICKSTEATNKHKLACSMLSLKTISAPSLHHGRKYEPVAVQEYEKITKVKTAKCGIFVCGEFPFLASSPDRIVNDKILVEVKCPFVSKDKLIDCTTVPYLLQTDVGLTLDKTHSYYYQVQGQLLCSGRDICHFVVYTLKDIKIMVIERDDNFITSMITTLEQFYIQYFREALLNNVFFKNTDKYNFL